MAEMTREQLRTLGEENSRKFRESMRKIDIVVDRALETAEEVGLTWDEALGVSNILYGRVRNQLKKQGSLYKNVKLRE